MQQNTNLECQEMKPSDSYLDATGSDLQAYPKRYGQSQIKDDEII